MEEPNSQSQTPNPAKPYPSRSIKAGLALLIVAVAGLLMTYYLQNHTIATLKKSETTLKTTLSQTKAKITTPKNPSAAPPPNPGPNQIEAQNFSLQYPTGWRIQAKPQSQGLPIVDITVNSPTGTQLLISANYGGRGGVCQPRSTDKPHTSGNLCPTKEYLSKELINETAYDANTPAQKQPLYLVTARYTDPTGKSQYLIGIEKEVKLNDPQMGLLFPFTSLIVNNADGSFGYDLEIHAVGKDATFLASADGSQITAALKTLRFSR